MIRIIIGMIIGGCIGAFVMCLCIAAGKADESCIYRSDCPLCTAILPTLAASAHGAAHKLNNVIYLI